MARVSPRHEMPVAKTERLSTVQLARGGNIPSPEVLLLLKVY